MNPVIAARAMQLIQLERKQQDEQWGDQAHHPDATWFVILMTQVGKLADEVLDRQYGRSKDLDELIEEATQVAAVATAHLEALLFRKQRGDEV